MDELIRHFLATAPCCWLLEYDWTATKQALPFLPHCSNIVMVGRLRWIESSPSPGSTTTPGFASRPREAQFSSYPPGQ